MSGVHYLSLFLYRFTKADLDVIGKLNARRASTVRQKSVRATELIWKRFPGFALFSTALAVS